MAVFENNKSITAIAGADFSAGLGKFVKFSTTGVDYETELAGNGERPDGMIGMNVAEGVAFPMIVADGCTVKTVAGTGGVTKGALIGLENGGLPVVAASGDVIIGKALTAASAGEWFEMQFFGYAGEVA